MGDDSFATLCFQRTQRIANQKPMVRFELSSPYSAGFTQQQLDMRRKTEILKYPSNKVSHTNLPTKRQLFAQAMSVNLNAVSELGVDLAAAICPNDAAIPIPTTSSDVPGPVMYLYEDKSVPLYNYITLNRSYPFDVTVDMTPWKFQTTQDVLCPHNSSTEIGLLLVNATVDKTSYSFTLNLPLSLYISGTIIDNNVNKTNNVSVSINYAEIQVYFSGVLIQSRIISQLFPTMVFDVSGYTGDFSATQYIGNMVVSDMKVYTEPGYGYNFKILYRLGIAGQGFSYFSNVQAYVYNNTSVQTTVADNCRVITLPTTPYMPFSIFAF